MIIHFTTVHPRTDTRIAVKEVATLARAFPGQVALFVQDGLGHANHAEGGYRIHDTGPRPAGRLRRMTSGAWRMYRAVLRARPRVVQFHDPELLPVGVLLRLHGIKVIYDAHEDLPRQVFHKHYLSRPAAQVLSLATAIVEKVASWAMSGIVVVVPPLLARFPAGKTILIANYPKLEEFADLDGRGSAPGQARFVYAGSLTESRGVVQMVEAIGQVGETAARLALLGTLSPEALETQLRALPGWARVEYLGWSDRATVAREIGAARAGLVVLSRTPQYVLCCPVKTYEYMAAGRPVIASDFPLWREALAEVGCALFVDPADPAAIARAMQWVLDHPEEAEAMGRRGRAAVLERFNWECEGAKLVALYRRLLS